MLLRLSFPAARLFSSFVRSVSLRRFAAESVLRLLQDKTP